MRQVPYGHCHCGCGEITKLAPWNHERDGWVAGEPLRYLAGHGNRNRVDPESRYVVEDRGYITPCWIWQREITKRGYGCVKHAGRRHLAHRWHYERANGPIPGGAVLDHLCSVRACVNPDHLEPVTTAENNRRSSLSKLGHGGAERARLLLAEGRTHQAIAQELGVSRSTITMLANGKTWRLT